MERVFISVGSNMGDRQANCRLAIRTLEDDAGLIKVVKKSPLYETEPWGAPDQPMFINAVIELETSMPPLDLIHRLKGVENRVGRTFRGRWGRREIDLDIVFYGDRMVEEEGLVIPHPYAHERAFVLVPLNDIAPEFVHPALKKTVRELLSAVAGREGVRQAGGF